MDSWLLIIMVFCVLMVLLAAVAKSAKPSFSGPWPFQVKRPLTSPEQVLYWRMVKALPDNMVLAQVQLSRFLAVKKGHRFHEWNNRINRLSADFVVCSKDAGVLVVIELDDATHAKPDRIEADKRKESALAGAGVRLVRWKVSALPDAAAIVAAVYPPAVVDAVIADAARLGVGAAPIR
jgi:very-short-patch-repair endonuclease